VAVAVVVRPPEVLLVRSRSGQTNGIPWQFPAGIVKPGEDPAMVAIEETLAETGIHAVIVRPLGARQHPSTNVLCEYLLCEYVAGDAKNVDIGENLTVAWIEVARLTRLIRPDLIHAPILEAITANAS
jgi:8-oxo-dGTP pyrophosphatase MutT (NUDIX family)